MKRTAVVIFARLPERGRVKTRLASELGSTAALDLHRACLQSTAALVDSLPARFGRFLYFTGDPGFAQRAAQQLALPERLTVRTQGKGSLGRRLARVLEELLDDGAEKVCFLGSDSPTLPRRLLLQGVKTLDRRDTVLGPAEDGGYYLIGTRAHWPEMFHGIDWGSNRAFNQTLRKLQRAGRSVALLPRWYDVDRPGDLIRLASDVRRRPNARHLLPLRRWLKEYSRKPGGRFFVQPAK